MNGRAAIVLADGVADVATVSDGRFGPELASVYDDWEAFVEFAGSVTAVTGPLVESELGCPVPAPRQVFATRAQRGRCIGKRADRVAESDAWAHIAGLTVGQDISDRDLQFAAGAQFSLGKSRRGYGPMGPWVVTCDEFADPDDLALGCSVDGETVQDSRSGDLVFTIPQLIAELSSVLPLLPGDVIFTGTPSGVGMGRTPPRFLAPGMVLETWIEGIGTMRNVCTSPRG